jgi:hypothetical protein
MSEETTELATPAAATSERSESQEQSTGPKVTSPDDPTEVEVAEAPAEKPEAKADAEDDDSEGSDDDKGDDEKPKKLSRSDRLRRQNERLKAELETLRSGTAPRAVEDKGAIEAVVAQKVGEPPKESDYANDWFAYERAMNAYEADKRVVARQVKEQFEAASAAQAERIREMAEDYQDHLAAAAKAIPDLMETFKKSSYAPSPTVEMLILEAGEKAPLVAYHLAKNPKLAASLNAMSPVQAAREIGRIEAQAALPKPKTATSASAPLTALKGSASPSSASRDLDAWLAKTYRKTG